MPVGDLNAGGPGEKGRWRTPAVSWRADGAFPLVGAQMNCSACGASVPDAARFCPECGHRLVAAPEERRLVTVLMADLVGFTAFSESTDPEQVKRLVDQCFDRLVADITAFGGRLDKIVGDEVVALFGTPIAHEDDCERAVRAALRMHETLATVATEIDLPLQMRVGVNTGEVLVGAMRLGGESTVTGDVINTAQRLQTLAAPGEVIVGAATYAATRDAIEYEALGLLSVKGRDEPVEAYRAVTTLAPPGRRRERGRGPLVGRAAEMGALTQALSLATNLRRAQLVVIHGDAGVGKSRLAEELAKVGSEQFGARVLSGLCVPYGDANAFGPVAEALRHASYVDGTATPAEARSRVSEAVSKTLGLAADAAEAERIVEGLLFVMDGVARPGVDPGRARDEAIRATLAYFEALANQAPVVLTLSDVHWAADSALELADRLLARLRNQPFILVCTARPGEEPRLAIESSRHNTLVLHLDALDRAATAQLVEALFEGCADDEMIATLLERSGGNPFFVEELVAYVQDSAEYRHVGPGEVPLRELPATLHGLVAARLDALEAAERSLLEDCAVVGGTGPLSAALALSGRDNGRRLVDRLTERDLIVIELDDFHFKSELIREVAYGTLTKAERARRHAQLAPILATRGEVSTDQVAHHYATAAELVQELGAVPGVPDDISAQALAALSAAARRAEEVESWVTSGLHHDRSLGLLPPDAGAGRWPALLGRARSRIAQRELQEGGDDAMLVLEEARLASDTGTEAAALNLLGELYIATGDYDEAEKVLGQAISRWRELNEVSGVANALRSLGLAYLFRGENAEADRLISEALASYRSVGDRRGEAWALQNLAWIAFANGEAGPAEHRLQHSAELFGELGDWGGLGWAFGLLAFVRYMQGRLDEAAELAEQIAVEGLETGNRWAVGMMDVLLANVALWRGRAAEAVRDGRLAIALFEDIGDRWGETQATAPVVRALAELGREDEYRATLSRFYDVARSLPDEGMRHIPRVVEACIELQYGDPERAQTLLAPIGHDDPSPANTDLQAARALMLLQLGEVEQALAILEREYQQADNDGPFMNVGSRLALAYAMAKRPSDALRVIGELEQRAGGTYHDRLTALWAEGAARLQLGEGDPAAPVGAAHAIATGTDAPLEHAIAALARAHLLESLGDRDAAGARADASRQLAALDITAAGWSRVFTQAFGAPTPTA
jgi:class 3 adenylate cyclase/tetratricopeptide (TPR) repeat protein